MTRCKFKCDSVRKFHHWDKSKGFLYEAEFSVVTGESEENKKFFAATPSGSLKICSYVEDRFIPGDEYFIDLSVAA